MKPPDARLPNGNRGLPAARFPCWREDVFSPHFRPADRLYWYDGDEEYVAGWYCGLCWPPGPLEGQQWTLEDEIRERDALARLL